jgi:hypothetical protein
MALARSILAVGVDGLGVSDFSHLARPLQLHGGVKAVRGELQLTGAARVSIPRSPELDKLSAFTLEATVTPAKLGVRQDIIEAQTPPVALFIEADGTLFGSIHTQAGWQSIKTQQQKLKAGERVSVRFARDESGAVSLEVNGKAVASGQLPGPLVPVGAAGFTIGAGPDGQHWQFQGSISNVRVRDSVVLESALQQRAQAARVLETRLRQQLQLSRVLVIPDRDLVDHRFDHIKSIIASAGVRDLSELSTLRIDRPTLITPNMVMVAPRRSRAPVRFQWSDIARRIATSELPVAARTLATLLPNRNSKAAALAGMAADAVDDEDDPPVIPGVQPRLSTRVQPAALSRASSSIRLVGAPKPAAPPLAALASNRAPLLHELLQPDLQGLRLKVDMKLFEKLDGNAPEQWPTQTEPQLLQMLKSTIPVNTSVIIAGKLDLTNQQLRIDPTVKTLYIIAEEIVGGVNASITWRRPGGSTPARARDPGKDGRSWSGIHTQEGSRNGLSGGHGQAGEEGIDGADGRGAPDLEIWVKKLTAMPDIDLNGENGIKGGLGQPGGNGGSGAKGQNGEWWWFFGKHCWKEPGHGGRGGNGGDGGAGGQGGGGGDGGNVTIGVLEGTLASAVTARAFRIKNQGGQPGRGGQGGPGGTGGRGGPHGNSFVDGDEVCTGGVDGANGARGQPGRVGPDGRAGSDGTLRFFEFTQEAWDEQLTRPWLHEVTPTQAFPGASLIIKGSKFADTDRVVLDGQVLTPTLRADQGLDVLLPENSSGGEKELFVRRHDGSESNRLRLWIKPRLDTSPSELAPGTTVELRGQAFVSGATVLFNGDSIPANVSSGSRLTFTTPDTGGAGTGAATVSLAVRNPDGLVSNTRTAAIPRIIETGFDVARHGLQFPNFNRGNPSWGTFEETFGALEVWHELLDPVFGHPVLTTAFFAFYNHFLKGQDAGGLATGFCTSMSSLVLDQFWQGKNDTFTRFTLTEDVRRMLTAIHGRLLSRESLVDLHDQGREGNARVVTSFRQIEANIRVGGDRESALMLFFIPSGPAWNAGYFDRLSDSHCIVPYRIVYPVGHDGTSMEGVKLFCWDCNHPFSPSSGEARNCRLEFRRTDGEIRFDYFDGGSSPKFRSEDGITLGTMSLGKYLLSDHDLPFGGPFGLTRFVIEFLLSPADLQVEDEQGRRTGRYGKQLLSEIPDSHPCYLAPGAYILPLDKALTRKIVGTGTGQYSYHSVSPAGTSISLEGVPTAPGQVDVLAMNADGTQVRFTPGASKSFSLTLGREVDGQARAVALSGFGGGPSAALDLTLSPDLSVVRLSNPGAPVAASVRVMNIDKATAANSKLDRGGVSVPTNHDLVVSVTDWADLALTVRALPFNA